VKEAEGYKVKALRIYKNGTKELVTEPQRSEFVVVPCTPVESRVLWMLSKGMKIGDPEIGYKIADACAMYGCDKHRKCGSCFFRDLCAYPGNPNVVRRGRHLRADDLEWTDPCTPIEDHVLELMLGGKTREAHRLGFRLAVECMRSGCFRERDCRACFFRRVCGFLKDPKWFVDKGIISREVAEAKLREL